MGPRELQIERTHRSSARRKRTDINIDIPADSPRLHRRGNGPSEQFRSGSTSHYIAYCLLERPASAVERNMTKLSTQDKTIGKLHEVAGAIKQKAGELTKNPHLEAEGSAEKSAGTIQKVVGKIEKAFGE